MMELVGAKKFEGKKTKKAAPLKETITTVQKSCLGAKKKKHKFMGEKKEEKLATP